MDQLSCLKGELLLIETVNNDQVEGCFHSINNEKTRLSLYNVKESPKSDKICDMRHYYRNEIKNITKLTDKKDNNIKNLNVKISQPEIEEIISISRKYVFINQIDSTFHEALQDLNNCEYVAVGTDSSEMGRKCKMPFLTLSTPRNIYIFDIQVIQYHAFDRGLKALLESETPKKIVHNSRKLSDCLFHQHHVTLRSVYDTQVADLIIIKNKLNIIPAKVKLLPECLTEYLGLPSDFFQEKLNILECTKRPLATEIKEASAKNIAFLHRLSEIMHDELMLPFTRGVQYFIEHLKSRDDFEAWQLCSQDEMLPNGFKNAIQY